MASHWDTRRWWKVGAKPEFHSPCFMIWLSVAPEAAAALAPPLNSLESERKPLVGGGGERNSWLKSQVSQHSEIGEKGGGERERKWEGSSHVSSERIYLFRENLLA